MNVTWTLDSLNEISKTLTHKLKKKNQSELWMQINFIHKFNFETNFFIQIINILDKNII